MSTLSLLPQSAARLLKLPPGRTVPCALALLAAGFVCELFFWVYAIRHPQLRERHAHLDSPAAPEEPAIEPSLLIQPRLEAPEIRSAWQELVERSRAAAAKGEMELAINLLEEAEVQVPNQPPALAEIAVQLEKCSAPARAIKLWERIHQFGTSAGVYYSAADAKLNLLYARTESGSQSAETLPVAAKNNLLSFGKFSVKEQPHSMTQRRSFTLSVPVQKNAAQDIKVKDVSIQVQFYDQINGRTLERTNATIRWKWASAPVDWQDEPLEVLDVDYFQAPGRVPGQERRYFGYVASVYYEDRLLDTRAEPPRLGQQYPPPRILSKEAAQ
jgi:hypothetical protein